MRYVPFALSPSTKIEPSGCRVNFARIGCAHLDGLERVPASLLLLRCFPLRAASPRAVLSYSASAAWALAMRSGAFLLGARPAELGDLAVGFELGLQAGDAVLPLEFALGEFRARALWRTRRARRRAWRDRLELLEHLRGGVDFVRLAGAVEEAQEEVVHQLAVVGDRRRPAWRRRFPDR